MMLLLIAIATLAASTGKGPIEAPRALRDAQCFTRAAEAADREYSKYYKADWYVHLRAIVHANEVRSIEVHVGPYDGSAGGGIAARYDCAADQLFEVEQER